MSDFFSSGWSVFIAAATLVGLAACLWLLIASSRCGPGAEDGSTGHTWDGDLRELNNPLPRWWMWLFILTVLFALGYLILYPGLGGLAGHLGWSSAGQHSREEDQAARELAVVYADFAAMPAEALVGQPRAMAIGERLFVNHCAACHGSDARGSKGFPDLTDGDWLYGGSPERIEETIAQGRRGNMPPMAAAVGSASEVRDLANHVLSLSGSPHDQIAAYRGRGKFVACAGCHGSNGKGNQQLGAPDLTDKVWLHGWGEEAIVSMVVQGKTNEMPAHAGRLSREQIHVLAAYVWSLSHGGPGAASPRVRPECEPGMSVIPQSQAPREGRAGATGSAQFISMYVSEQKIYARSVKGRFVNWRWTLVWLTQLLFYGLPWVGWNGRQAVLFDLVARRFYIGPLVLYPQDFVYLTGLLVVCAAGLFLFTAVAGRLWCGYACPQTVYTEIFTWLERRIEGDRVQRMKLDAAPWSARKVVRRVGKHAAWLAVGMWTGFTFVGYFTPIHALATEVVNAALGPWEVFWILFYGMATYGNAGYLREQVCKYMCPYARFQGAMFDKDTWIITYDARRGDPRGSRPRQADPKSLGKGDCVDCGLCVQVCPTGIDIRRGQQYECIGCAACIDVCDGVMDKMNYPRGLVRYDTQNGVALGLTQRQRWARVLRPRVLGYAAVLLAMASAVLAGLATRPTFRVDVVRDRGALARTVQEGRVENVYRLQLMNAAEQARRYRIEAEAAAWPGLQVVLRAGAADVGPTAARWVPVSLQLPPEQARQAGAGAHPIVFRVTALGDDGQPAEPAVLEKSTFVVPR